jgi:hypothetical protein
MHQRQWGGTAATAAAEGQAVPAAVQLEWFDLRRKALQQLKENGICAVDATDTGTPMASAQHCKPPKPIGCHCCTAALSSRAYSILAFFT